MISKKVFFRRFRSRQFRSCQAGATAIVVGITFMVLLASIGISIDMARTYAVQSKAQNALDAALLGAVSTSNSNITAQGQTLTVQQETQRLFNANYPTNYMGATTGNLVVTQVSNDPSNAVYNATVPLGVPNTIMSIFNHPSTQLHILSQVTKGLTTQHAPELEVALVLDNTLSMNCIASSMAASCTPQANSKLVALKAAATDLTNILFGNQATLNNLHISIVPFSSHVNLGSLGSNWIQAAFKPKISNYCCDALFYSKFRDHFVSNRTADSTADLVHTDISDSPPTSDVNDFRTPYAYGLPGKCSYAAPPPYANYYDDPYNQPFATPDSDGNYYYYDFACNSLEPISFALNSSASVITQLNKMIATGDTRINVGLMWGWFTLSPNWQGIWNSSEPTLPETPNPYLNKAIILMTDGQNELYTPTGDTPSAYTNDDTITAALCDAIKAQNITIYTIGFGTAATVNTALLSNCASSGDYFLAPTNEELSAIFQQIGDDVTQTTLRLSE